MLLVFYKKDKEFTTFVSHIMKILNMEDYP